MSNNELQNYLDWCLKRLENDSIYLDERIFLHSAISSTYKELIYRRTIANSSDFSSN